jgi:3-hydroxy-3-methylglutaryl CoA synthase
LRLASTTYTYHDLQAASLVSAALQLGPALETCDYANGQRAVTAALIDGLRDHQKDRALVVGTDAPLGKPGSDQEMQYGAAAGALLVGSENLVASCLGWRSTTVPFVDHFRPKQSQFDYYWEERWIRDEGYLKIPVDTVQELLRQQGMTGEQVRHLVLASPFSGIASLVARKLKLPDGAVVDGLMDDCGYSGAAHPMLLLGRALERAKPDDLILVCGFGQGCDAILFRATEAVRQFAQKAAISRALAKRKTETAYLKLLSFSRQLDYAWGMRGEKDAKTALSQQYRASDQVFGFVGGKCDACGTVQFPRLGKCVNPACQVSNSLIPYPLADEPARVLTFTSDWLQYTPSPPLYFGLVQFANGARVLMEIVDVDPTALRVGLPVRPVFRVKERDTLRHYDRYFWKAAPVAALET